MSNLSGRTVLITGGSGGIGIETARLFLQEGATVFLGGTCRDKMNRTLDELASGGGRVEGVVADIRNPDGCEQLVQAPVQETGRLDVLVNSAGVWMEGPAEETTEAMWDHVLDVNLKGTFFTARQAIPELEKTRGCIINIGSDAGLVGNKGAAVYCASKGGVTLLTKALALELAPKGIRVNAVCPADVDTPMLSNQAKTYGGADPEGYLGRLLGHYPEGTGRFIKPQEVARTVVFLAAPGVDAMTGACLSIDFGITAGY